MKGVKFDDSKIRTVLDAKAPDVTPTPLGRHRLVNALANKFGPSWRNHPDAKSVLQDFDVQHDFHARLRELEHAGKRSGGK